MISAIVLMLSVSSFCSRTIAFLPGSSLRNNLNRRVNTRNLSMASAVRVTTYNVLSSDLGGADYFTSCRPEDLKASYRLGVLKQKLDIETDSKAIICLQEVSTVWAGVLHTYFANRGYHMVTGLYGNKFNGYMGVVTAVPISEYEIMSVDITKIGDTKKGPKRGPKPTTTEKALEIIKEPYFSLLKLLKLFGIDFTQEKPLDPWNEATRKFNQMVSIRLKSKSTAASRPFVVGTYHMPCMFKLPSVMMIHCALAAQHIQKYSNEDPYLLVGDFNIKPGSSMYRMLTEGSVEADNVELPPAVEGDDWEVKVQPLQSAYKECQGVEPEFTNWAKVKDDEPFVDTLDYIFMSKDWKVESVVSLPSKTELVGPLPVATEPSDHLLLSATVSLI